MVATQQEINVPMNAGFVDISPSVVRRRESRPTGSRKAFHVAEGTAEWGDGYAFVVKGQQETGEIKLKVGGVELENALIDSGASCNLIDFET